MEYFFSNVIGNPLDTAVALHYLLSNCILRDFPKLKILAVHGGGYLPSYSAWIDHAWVARVDSRTDLPRPPTEYLKKKCTLTQSSSVSINLSIWSDCTVRIIS